MAITANQQPDEGLVFSPSNSNEGVRQRTALVQALAALRSKHYVELLAAREQAKRNFLVK